MGQPQLDCRSPHARQLTEREVLFLVAVLVPVAPGMWDDVVYTCRHQRPFCSESCVSNWLRTSGNRRE